LEEKYLYQPFWMDWANRKAMRDGDAKVTETYQEGANYCASKCIYENSIIPILHK